MATLQEMLESDLGLGSEKVASVQAVDGMDKLAMELGLFGDMEKSAEAVEHEKDEGDGEEMNEKEEKGEKKEAGMGLDDIYSTLFPEDAGVAVVKTAEEVKEASVEETVGAVSYDFYKQQMDNRIEKIAMDMLQGKFAAEATSNGNGDAEPIAAIKVPNNRDHGKGAINTAPQHQGDLGATNGPADIGEEKMVAIKSASVDQQALMQEMFGRGQEMGEAIADQMDKMAAEQEKVAGEELQLDEEGMKTAAVCGAFIERGQFEKLAELGMERHGDSLHYFYPYVEEKVAASGANTAMANFVDRMSKIAEEAADAAKKPTGDEKHYVRRALLGNPISGAIEAEKGKKLKTFGHGLGHAAVEGVKGMGIGAGVGSLGGLATSALSKGRISPKQGAGMGALMGAHVGGQVGAIKGHFDSKADEIHSRYSKHKAAKSE